MNPSDARVFIIEDSADNLFIATELLRTHVGVKYCNGRATGRQFFQFVEANPNMQLDLILLDIQIPREDGYTVLKQIRKTAALQGIKVIAVTANVLPQDVERAREAGFDGFIGKPIQLERFPEQISRILSGESVWESR